MFELGGQSGRFCTLLGTDAESAFYNAQGLGSLWFVGFAARSIFVVNTGLVGFDGANRVTSTLISLLGATGVEMSSALRDSTGRGWSPKFPGPKWLEKRVLYVATGVLSVGQLLLPATLRYDEISFRISRFAKRIETLPLCVARL